MRHAGLSCAAGACALGGSACRHVAMACATSRPREMPAAELSLAGAHGRRAAVDRGGEPRAGHDGVASARPAEPARRAGAGGDRGLRADAGGRARDRRESVYVRAPGARTVTVRVYPHGLVRGARGAAGAAKRASCPSSPAARARTRRDGADRVRLACDAQLHRSRRRSPSGVYIVKLHASTGAQSDCLFVVRPARADAAARADADGDIGGLQRVGRRQPLPGRRSRWA